MNFDDIFNEELIGQMVTIGTNGVINIALATAILIVGYLVAGVAKRNIQRLVQKNPRVDPTIASFAASLVRYAILVVVFVAVLNRFGVETTSVVAAIGAAAFAVGLALQGTLSNVAAGVMIVFFRPYKLGDYIEVAGASGSVRDINLFTTELSTPDNKKIIVPNGQAWGDVITNYTSNPTRRVDFVFSISYEDNIDKAMDVIHGVIAKSEIIHAEPAPFTAVKAHGESSVDLVTRVWGATDDYWPIYFEMMKNVKEAFDANDIEIPYPHSVEIKKKG
jgi:small conductance mechanosensitive channel